MEITNEYLNDPKTKVVFYPSDVDSPNIEPHRQLKAWLDSQNREYLDFSKYEDNLERYSTYHRNEHHFTFNCHYNFIIPKLAEYLHFDYKKDDFDLIPNSDISQNDGSIVDVSYLYPKKNKQFITYSNGETYTGNFDVLLGYNNPLIITKYHNVFRFPHQTCFIENLSENNGKSILISGDSHNIPQLPILAYYYKTIYFLDNRHLDGHGRIDYTKIQFDDVLFSMFEKYDMAKQIYENFVI